MGWGPAILRVALRVGEKRIPVGGRKIIVPERFAVGGEGTARGPAPAGILLPGGMTLADWALLAERRLEAREYALLLTEANAHIRKHGSIKDVLGV